MMAPRFFRGTRSKTNNSRKSQVYFKLVTKTGTDDMKLMEERIAILKFDFVRS